MRGVVKQSLLFENHSYTHTDSIILNSLRDLLCFVELAPEKMDELYTI